MTRKAAKTEYRFFEKDPIIDLIRTEAQREGYIKGGGFRQTEHEEKRNITRLSERSGVSAGAIHNWLFGETKRPQRLSTRFVLEALGVSIKYFRNDGTQIRTGAGL